MARWQKPPQCVRVNYGDPITRRLSFAAAPGWDRGQGQPFGTVTRDRFGRSASINGTLPVGGPASTADFGWANCSSNDGWYTYTEVGVPTFEPAAGFSCMVLTRPLVIPAISTFNRRTFQKRLDGAPTSPGFDMFLDSFLSLSWSFEWSNGVAEQTLRSVTTLPVLNQSVLLVGTLDPIGGTARLYVNGALDVSAALAFLPVNDPLQPIGVCGGIGPAGDRGGDNCVAITALWNRELEPQEITAMWADPYRMFRT